MATAAGKASNAFRGQFAECLWVPGVTSLTADTWRGTTATGPRYNFFRTAQADYVNGILELPHGYRQGDPVTVHVHCTPAGANGANARNVRWLLYAHWGQPGVVLPAPASWTNVATVCNMSVPANSQWKPIVFALATMTAPSGSLPSDQIHICLARDGANGGDTFTDAKGAGEGSTLGANLAYLTVGGHAQVYAPGSLSEYSYP